MKALELGHLRKVVGEKLHSRCPRPWGILSVIAVLPNYLIAAVVKSASLEEG